MTETLLTTDELADRLGVPARKVIELAKAKRIPEVRVSPRCRRFDYQDVLEALKGRGCCNSPEGAGR